MSGVNAIQSLREWPRRLLGYPLFLWRQLVALKSDLWFIALAIFLGLALLLPLSIYSVPPGAVGVMWKRFGGGTVIDRVYAEGARFVFPWDKLFIYDVRLQTGERQMSALSADGLRVDVDLSWVFSLVPAQAGVVHRGVGPDYKDTLMARVVESVVRDKVSLIRTEELHSPERAIFERNVFAGIKSALLSFDAINRLDPNYTPVDGDGVILEKGVEWLRLESVLIKEIRFPVEVQQAYIRKNTARALVDEYNFRVAVEQKEVERKMIEALGIRNFQEVVNQGLTDSYLRWKTLEAYVATSRALAESPNAKLVVMGPGTGVGGMPMILNTNALDGMGTVDPRTAGAPRGSGAQVPKAASGGITPSGGNPTTTGPSGPASTGEGATASGKSDSAEAGRPVSALQMPDDVLPRFVNTPNATGLDSAGASSAPAKAPMPAPVSPSTSAPVAGGPPAATR